MTNRSTPSGARWPELTAQRKEILQFIAEGMSNKAIGEKLHLSEHTVKTHISGIFRVLGARDRAHAVHLGLGAGLIGAPPTDAQLRARIERAETVLAALRETRAEAPDDSRYARLYDALNAAVTAEGSYDEVRAQVAGR